MISCEKAALICNKSQYKEASFLEILKLRFHLAVCKTCAAFSKKNADLTTLCEKASLKSLSESDKEAMKKRLESQG